MIFIKTQDPEIGTHELSQKLTESLKSGKVLWLISGGSNIKTEIAILNNLEDKLTKNLLILLVDERYGPKDHQDSNYYQLMAGGLAIKEATFPDILESNPSPEEARLYFEHLFNQFKDQADVIIGQLGIGDDGHVAGVLPESRVVFLTDTVVYYESGPYKRLSLWLSALEEIDITFVFCFGQNKKDALERLFNCQESMYSLPAMILPQMADVRVYNDFLEGEVS